MLGAHPNQCKDSVLLPWINVRLSPLTPAMHETSVIQKEDKTAEGVNLKSKTCETIITGYIRLAVAIYCH